MVARCAGCPRGCILDIPMTKITEHFNDALALRQIKFVFDQERCPKLNHLTAAK